MAAFLIPHPFVVHRTPYISTMTGQSRMRVVDHVLIPREDHKRPAHLRIDEGKDPTTSSTLLESLPTELLQRIGSYTEATDLQNLRLTCRELESKIRRTFLDAFYGTRSCLLSSPASMQALIAVSEQAVYSQSLRTLVLCVGFLPDPWDMAQRHSGYMLQPQTRQGRAEQRETRAFCDKIHRAHEQFWLSRRWIEQLHTLLGNLAKHDRPLRIRVTDTSSETFSGQRQFERLIGFSDHLDPWDPSSEDANDIMLACLSSPARIEHFEVSGATAAVPLNAFQATNKMSLFASSQEGSQALSNIRALTLSLSSTGSREEHTEGLMNLASHVLPSMRNLRKLELRGKRNPTRPGGSACDYVVRAHVISLLKRLHLPKIHTLALDGVVDYCDQLMGFIARHHATLKRIILNGARDLEHDETQKHQIDGAVSLVLRLARRGMKLHEFTYGSNDILEIARQRQGQGFERQVAAAAKALGRVEFVKRFRGPFEQAKQKAILDGKIPPMHWSHMERMLDAFSKTIATS
ncbi:hypothetical protein LTR86_003726 [Recurvomyces mirabilis]|nr:hypothetical protein LTR86_003726 [Recurvomyces mirabilis]